MKSFLDSAAYMQLPNHLAQPVGALRGATHHAASLVKICRRLTGMALLLAWGTTVAAQAQDTPDGETVYMENCSVCHGEAGDGRSGARFGLNPPPISFVDDYPGDRDRMIAAATHGVPGTAMVGWGGRLSPEEIEAAVDYILQAFVSSAAAENDDPHAGLDLGDTASQTTEVPAMPAASQSVKKDDDTPLRESQSPAAMLYARNCSVCHGEDGAGALWGRQGLNPPPVDFTDEQATRGLTRERMIAAVTHGKPGTAMAGFGKRLTQEEIITIVDYIRSEFMMSEEGAKPPESYVPYEQDVSLGLTPRDRAGYDPVPMDAPMPKGLDGRPARGASIFVANCVTCHGAGGQGDGPRAYFIFPKPRDFTSSESRRALNRPAIFTAVQHGVRGREMPGWRHVLSDQEIADVTEYVFRTFIDSP